MISVIKGPAAFSYEGCNGHRYWFGVASGNRHCHKNRRTADRAIEDARSLEVKINEQA